MTAPVIETPRGAIFITKVGKAELKWSPTFKHKWQGNYSRAQRFVDSEVLRLSEPYTPLLTGTLIKTGTLGTEIGSGLVQWIAPYSQDQYYSPKPVGSRTGPLRGPQWFERMKGVSGNEIIQGARKIAGGSK